MNRQSPFKVILLLAVVSLMLHAVPAPAQCVVTGTTNGTDGMGNNTAYKNVTNATKCQLTGFNNVVECNPGGAPPTMTGATRMSGPLTATAAPMAVNPFCNWKCDCPGSLGTPGVYTVQVTISGPDGGLPVELMDFEIEDGEESGDDAESEEDT